MELKTPTKSTKTLDPYVIEKKEESESSEDPFDDIDESRNRFVGDVDLPEGWCSIIVPMLVLNARVFRSRTATYRIEASICVISHSIS